MLVSAMHWLMVMLILGALVWCVAKCRPLKFPAGQPSVRDTLGIRPTQVHSVGPSLEPNLKHGLETEMGGEI
jgi:hypothetical protein